MSIQHIALVLEADGLCAQEKAVLTAFCNHTDPSGRTFAGEERLMRESGMPRSTFRRWRGLLVTRGLLVSRRKGRKGGGRVASDTWVNLKLLKSMRDSWFDCKPVEQDSEPSPFDVATNGLTGETKGESNGLTGETTNGLTSETSVVSPVRPVTLTNPQSEPSETLFGDLLDQTPVSSPPVMEGFDAFWAAYPRKIGKVAAEAAWKKAIKRNANREHIIDFITQQADAWTRNGKDPQYIPHASTWLNGSRYLEEIDTTGSAQTAGHQPYRNPTDFDVYDEAF